MRQKILNLLSMPSQPMRDLSYSDYFHHEFYNMQGCDIETLIQTRLNDLVDQIKFLHAQGEYETAELLRQEGCDLASFADSGSPFLYIKDLTNA